MRRPEAGKTVLCLVAGLALGACSWMPSIDLDKKIDYKSQGAQLPPLEVPPDLTRPSADERYAVPEVNARGTATYSEYSRERGAQRTTTPGASAVLPQLDNAKVQRDGNQRWLVVKGTPEQVWPTVKDFWQEAGFIVNIEIPAAGIMETDWAENRARVDAGTIRNFFSRVLDFAYSSAERDKFRVRIERGTEPGTTEIFISHRGMEEVYSQAVTSDQTQTRWQPRPPDPLLEAQMLGRLMLRFGADTQRAQAQLSAPATVPPRATLVKGDNGERTLTLEDQFDRAWRRVGLALDRVGFTVEDRDRSQGLYYVRYIDPQIDNKTADKPGMLSRLFTSDKPKLDQFRIQVKDGTGNGCNVNVLAKDGKQESSETAGRILTLLYDQLK
ncbi:MAG TPA: outer membrane protein assembly factor BamC [Burkholderiales bacterium]|nr:outer membrane protein assembly factor BamC [Burkholderiales bacterium]